jgi:hypothetical protein
LAVRSSEEVFHGYDCHVQPLTWRGFGAEPADGDTLLFVVEQEGNGACHTGNFSCFFRAFGPDETTSSDVRDA